MNVHNDKLCLNGDNLQYENKTLPESNTGNSVDAENSINTKKSIDTANSSADNSETVTATDTSENADTSGNATESTDSADYSHAQGADLENPCVCRHCSKDCHTENISAQGNTFTNENHPSQDTKLSHDPLSKEQLGKLIAEIIDSYIEKMANNPPPKTISGNSSPFVPATPRKPRSIEEASLFASQLIRRSKNQGN